MFQVSNIHFQPDGTEILKDVSFTVPRDHFTVIVGNNGAGKSTLLKIMTGLITPHGGSITFDNRPLQTWDTETLAEKRAVVLQESSLPFAFTVEEVVRFGMEPNAHRFKRDALTELNAVLEAMDIASIRSRLYPLLSSGEKQRVLLARALMQLGGLDNPAGCLILDEPTSNLDIEHQFACLHTIRELKHKGVTILAVVHDLNLAYHFADYAIMLMNGSIHATGKVEDCLSPERVADAFHVATEKQVSSQYGYVTLGIYPKEIRAQKKTR